ncbi:MAG: calcium/sodium antiporter [Desulfobulbaceae bacterium]|nr:calcium/sodium antiporter [Desulfobulbaceae bacterium]
MVKAFQPSIGIAFFFVAVGLLMLFFGGEALVSGATKLARRLGMSTLMIGLTVVAFGTSVPELFVSLTATLQHHPDIMIGNVVGSNIANVGLILGISALTLPLRLTLVEVWIELILVLAGSVILLLCTMQGYFPRSIGVLFILVLISYTYFSYRGSRTKRSEEANDHVQEGMPSIPVSLTLIAGGLFFLSFGADIFIRGAAAVARWFGVSELIIGLTLAAVGTSLPELASSFSALRRNEPGLLIGNVIGSNMFNLFMVLGLTAAISPVELSGELLYRDLPVMVAFTLVLLPILRHSGGTLRWHGAFLLAAYIGYYFFLF